MSADNDHLTDAIWRLRQTLERTSTTTLAARMEDPIFGDIIEAELDRRRCKRLAQEFEAKDAATIH